MMESYRTLVFTSLLQNKVLVEGLLFILIPRTKTSCTWSRKHVSEIAPASSTILFVLPLNKIALSSFDEKIQR